MTNEARLAAELSIVRATVKAGLDAGYSVTVFDGQECTVEKSRKLNEILAALRTVDEDAVIFYGADDKRIGSVFFVYGNEPYEVINDYTNRPEIQAIYNAAELVANRVEARR